MSQRGDKVLCSSPSDSTEELIRRIREGEDEAFALLAVAYTPRLRALVSSVQIPREEKADLMQEGLLGLYQAVIRYDPALSSFSTFASLCIRRSVTDALRQYYRRARGIVLGEDPSPDSAEERTPERILMGKEALRMLDSQLPLRLSPLEERIFRLHCAGLSPDQIGRVVEKSGKSVNNALYRIRKKLAADR